MVLALHLLGSGPAWLIPQAVVTVILFRAGLLTDDRLVEVCRQSEGFVYGVNLLGVTGERADVDARATQLAKRLKAATDLPVVMGFGVSTPEQARVLVGDADGVVVASAIMRRVLDGASPDDTGSFVGALRSALDH